MDSRFSTIDREVVKMKCDKLKPIDLECNIGKDVNGVEHREPWKAYDIDEVDDSIAELKQILEDVQATAYAESVDAEMRDRRLKRALWLARANRALEKIAWFNLWNAGISTMNPEDGARQEYDKWKKSLGKFLKKAEDYK